MRYLDVEYVARNSRPVQHVQEPSVYFIPFVAPRPPHLWIFLHETSNRIDEYVQIHGLGLSTSRVQPSSMQKRNGLLFRTAIDGFLITF